MKILHDVLLWLDVVLTFKLASELVMFYWEERDRIEEANHHLVDGIIRNAGHPDQMQQAAAETISIAREMYGTQRIIKTKDKEGIFTESA